MIRRPPRSTPFPTRRSSDLGQELQVQRARGAGHHHPCGAQHVEPAAVAEPRSEEHTSELQSRRDLVCRLLLEKKKKKKAANYKNTEIEVPLVQQTIQVLVHH